MDHKKEGKQKELKLTSWQKWLLPITGLLALIWFLIRVIPKPSRARYPCQRIALPLAVGFLGRLAALLGVTIIIKRMRKAFHNYNYLTVVILVVVAIIGSGIFAAYMQEPAFTRTDHSPLGRGKGIFAGRVIWAYNSDITSWNGKDNYWWEDQYTDQKKVNQIWTNSLMNLTGTENPAAAWEKLFIFFNSQHKRGEQGYKEGETIAVKLNLNTQKSHQDRDNEVDLSPHVVYTLVASLVNHGKIREEDIILYDASRVIADKIYKKINEEFAEVKFVDRQGTSGRIKAEAADNAEIYYNGIETDKPDYLPERVKQASYMINLASMKKHSLAGITLTAKNHFGSIYNQEYQRWTPSHLHQGVSVRNNDYGSPNPLVNLIGHKDLGGKTLLYIIDGLYGGMNQQTVEPNRWSMEPFNGDWTSSLFISQDPVAIDSVVFDFLRTETNISSASDNYLHEAAQADDPPSGISYDPEDDGNNLNSLGVHEHWNNPQEKQYQNIELIKVND